MSEKLGGGVAYLKKGVVQEVTGHKQCRILLDSGGVLLAKVRQSSLETALPKGECLLWLDQNVAALAFFWNEAAKAEQPVSS